MVRVVFSTDVFVPKQKSVKAKVKLRTKDYQSEIKALIDSGATDNFMSPALANRCKLPTYKLKKPRIIRNVDGTRNSLGSVTEAADLIIHYGPHQQEKQTFFIINLGGDDMILGMTFLEMTNPPINWRSK